MTRQRALNEGILGNANLWAGQRSLNVGLSGKPFFRRIKERIKNMQQTVYNPQKGRLETIDIDFTDENTTWFDECEDSHGIFSKTDLHRRYSNQRSRLHLSTLRLRHIQSGYRQAPPKWNSGRPLGSLRFTWYRKRGRRCWFYKRRTRQTQEAI